MSEPISLKDAETKAFTSIYNDGLWDVFLGCFLLMFAIAPLLSASLGDFWSSAVFLPFWALVFVVIRLIRKQVVIPRVGFAKFGRARKAKLRRFSILMLVVDTRTSNWVTQRSKISSNSKLMTCRPTCFTRFVCSSAKRKMAQA